jgi:hypothetical protein
VLFTSHPGLDETQPTTAVTGHLERRETSIFSEKKRRKKHNVLTCKAEGRLKIERVVIYSRDVLNGSRILEEMNM